MRIEERAEVPAGLRAAYLRSLGESQELFVEHLVRGARKAALIRADRVIGYAAVHESTLVELFVEEAELLVLDAAFGIVFDHFRVTRALCKSFDSQMVTAASRRPARVKTIGHLFRRLVASGVSAAPGLVPRRGTERDVEAVLSIHDGFFDDPSEIEGYARAGGLFLYASREGGLVGCGVFTRIVPEQSYVDVGMVVAPDHRRRGIGAQIVAHVTSVCVDAGWRPVCGCDAENVASRRTLERAGFRTAHSLLELTYPGT
jgi:GNAT superfamily N-acetyltransferase